MIDLHQCLRQRCRHGASVIARELRMLSKGPAWKVRAQGRQVSGLLVLLTAVFAVLMMLAAGSAQACPRNDSQADVKSANASVIQVHRLLPITSAVVKSAPAKPAPIDHRGCCGATHSGCAGLAGGCCPACFSAVHDMHASLDLERGPSGHAVGKQAASLSRGPPPDFRPPRHFA